MKKFLCCAVVFLCALGALKAERMDYLRNGKLKIGVDLDAGGAITWLSQADKSRNYINNYDRGRYVQQSYYGDADGSDWNGQPWMWNPVQAGNWQNKSAKLLKYRKMGGTIYVKTVPLHWATGQLLEDCVMECWITLKENVAVLKYRFEYLGNQSYTARHQEMPAVFLDADCNTLCFTEEKGLLRRLTNIGEKNQYAKISKNFAAFIDAKTKIGVGIYAPGTNEITYYRRKDSMQKVGPNSPACSYLAPIRTFAITPGLIIEYEVYLSVGMEGEILRAFGLSK